MSFLTYDLSEHEGKPLELFTFVYNSIIYRFCTLDGGVQYFEHNGDRFPASSISRPGHEQSEDFQKTTIDLKVPRTFPIVELFFLGPPEGVVSLTINRLHLIDPDYEYLVVFKGRVISMSLSGDEATLHCESVYSSLKRPGVRLVYETQCVHGLYQQGCNLLKDDWQVLGSVLDASGINIIVQEAGAFEDGWFTGGVFVCGDVRRMIANHVGADLELLHPVRSDVIGKDCIIYPGCDHTIRTCESKFNNLANSMAFSWLPDKNAFSGDNIFW